MKYMHDIDLLMDNMVKHLKKNRIEMTELRGHIVQKKVNYSLFLAS